MLGLFAPTPAFSRAAWAWGLALAVTLPAGAQTPAAVPAAGAQAPSALQRWHVRYDLGPDGRATMTQELHNQVLQAGALEDLKTYSIGFSISTFIFGGSAPLVMTELIKLTHSTMIPAFASIIAAVITLIALIFVKETKGLPLRAE